MRERSCCRNCRSLTTAARTRKSGSSCCYVSATKLPHFGPCKSTFKRRVTSLCWCSRLFFATRRYTRASLLVYIMRNCPENDRNGRLLFKFRSQADPVPVAGRRKGCEKFPSTDNREGHGGLRTAVSLRLVQSHVVPAEWKPVDDERGIDGQLTRWQTAASSQLHNLHALRETNGTYAVLEVDRKWKFRVQNPVT